VKRALVTGGGGFLGSYICRDLRARGVEVVSLQRGDYPALAAMGVTAVRGDLADAAAVMRAAEGCDTVFHVAAKAGVWGSYESYRVANVVGTESVLAACAAQGVARLVYTSTPSVVHGGDDVAGVDESAPYASEFLTAYPETKAEAERMVLAQHGEKLATVALRPHLIWGPGDNHLVPRIIDRHRAGRLRFVGDGSNVIDGVYVENAATAHLLAADCLERGGACGGKAYFITNGEPMPLRDLVNGIVVAAGLPPVRRTIPPAVAYAVGALLELIFTLLRRESEPMMTRFVAKQLSTDHWYDISASARDFGYQPAVSTEEGLRRLAEALRGKLPPV
jgi:nucleoside-diphosphate-sugar epimerase